MPTANGLLRKTSPATQKCFQKFEEQSLLKILRTAEDWKRTRSTEFTRVPFALVSA